MCMFFHRRLQILLDDERHDRIVSVARQRGVSVATVVREAIDRGVPKPDRQRLDAGQRILAADDMDVHGVEDLKRELADARGGSAAPS